MHRTLMSMIVLTLALSCGRPAGQAAESARNSGEALESAALYRSPVDVALSPDGLWLVTVNETSNSLSLISTKDQCVVDEVSCGDHPADVAFCPDSQTVVVSCAWSGDVRVFQIADQRLGQHAVVDVGYEPSGLVISPDGSRAFIGLVAGAQVAEIDLESRRVGRRFEVGNWPRYLTVSPDGLRLAVGCGGDGTIHVIDTQSGDPLYSEPLVNGINLGHMVPSSDGMYAYFTWMVYRTNPINVGNLRRGWLLASRIGRVRLDGPQVRQAISLDVPGKAVADPHGIAMTTDEQRLVASAAGTHELLVYRLTDLPFVGVGGPGDLIDRRLENDFDRFHRIEVGGRPMGLCIAGDDSTVYVANYLRDSIQIVSLDDRQVTNEIDLGGPEQISLARRGMAIFHDGQRSLDQWYSCHSCHRNGGVNSRPMDTMNDGSEMTLKTVLPLYDVSRTQPWTWHGWQDNLENAIHKSLTSTMLGKPPADEETRALLAYLDQLEAPPNPHRNADGSLSEAAQRGKQVFQSSRAACADCHSGPYYTDGLIHDVGLGSSRDVYEGYNTPSLRGVYRKVRLLHSGRARSLERVVTDLHSPEKVSGTGGLTEAEVQDLIAFLRSL